MPVRITENTLILLLLSGLAMGFTTACNDAEIVLPASLRSAQAFAVARGDICLQSEDIDGLIEIDISACPGDTQGAIGLVVDTRGNRVGVADMSLRRPRLVNLNTTIPGVSHIPVGQHPVDIAVSTDGTVAYTVNQLDRTISPINLWKLRAVEQPAEINGSPIKIDVHPNTDQLIIATNNPSQLLIRNGLKCSQPDTLARHLGSADEGCTTINEHDESSLELNGNIADITLSPRGDFAYLVYNNRNDLDIIALTEDALSQSDGACIDGQTAVPCLTASIALVSDQAAQFGFQAISTDPLGVFLYVNDRARNQVIVIDRVRQTIVDASTAVEPPLASQANQHGIPVVPAPIALSGDVARTLVWQNPDDANHALYRYDFGAYVGSDNGAVYVVQTMTTYCELRSREPLIAQDSYYNNILEVYDHDEAECLTLPEWPLDEQESDTLAHRLLETDHATLAVNPEFALLDSRGAQGRLTARSSCDLPEQQLELMRAFSAANPSVSQAIGCFSEILPQPLAGAELVDELGQTSVERASLLQKQTLMIQPTSDNSALEQAISREIYDIRLREEAWTVTYEGVLPATQRDDGLVDQDDSALFHTGGANLCSAGVQSGDRLIIQTTPGTQGTIPTQCELFNDENNPAFRTYEIVEYTPSSVRLAVVGAPDLVQELPTRECFPRGLRFQIRPHDQWIVVGERTGLISEYERQDDECVLRPGAEFGDLNSRVQTGETFQGPFLSFYLYEGLVEPIRDTSFSFDIERNFIASRFDGGTAMPADISIVRNLPEGDFLVVPDMANNFVYLRNLTLLHERNHFLR